MNLSPYGHEPVIARLNWNDEEYSVCKKHVTIGRHSSKGEVDVVLGISSYISRVHLELFLDKGSFFLKCIGKNGAFVNNHFIRAYEPPVRLPDKCVVRFPSASMEVYFCSLLDTLQQNLWGQQSASERLISSLVSPTQSTTVSACSSQPASRPTSPPLQSPLTGSIGDLPSPHTVPAGDGSWQPRQPSSVVPPDVLRDVQKYNAKPPFSYAQLIVQAIASTQDKRITLSGVYAFITKNYPFFRTADKGWQNSIRHNLSLNRNFMKVPRSTEDTGKGSFWQLDPSAEEQLLTDAFSRKRQKRARASPLYGQTEYDRSCKCDETAEDPISSEDWPTRTDTSAANGPGVNGGSAGSAVAVMVERIGDAALNRLTPLTPSPEMTPVCPDDVMASARHHDVIAASSRTNDVTEMS